jgi:hypothetical protein
MEMVVKKAEADATIIGPTIVPIGIIPGCCIVGVRYSRDTVWRGRLGSTGSIRSNRGVRIVRSGRAWRYGRPALFGNGVRRRRGTVSGRWRARHKLIAVCGVRLIRAAPRKLCRSSHCNDCG